MVRKAEECDCTVEVVNQSDELIHLGGVGCLLSYRLFRNQKVEITHAVQQEGYDLVLAGSRGLAVWEQFFVGSTAKRLIRKCPASVWIAKDEHVGPPKVVLAATDFSDVSVKAVKQALWVAQQASAEFHLLHVVDSTDVPEDIISRIPEGSSLVNEIKAEAERRMESIVESICAERSRIRLHFAAGTPWRDICRTAQHLHADLVALGTACVLAIASWPERGTIRLLNVGPQTNGK
jgi:universal stress protein E